MPFIRIENICKSFSNGTKKPFNVLKNITLSIDDGEFVAIMGKSGSGKSTLLNIIGCVERIDKGKYYFNKQDISSMKDSQLAKLRGNQIGFVFQDYALIEEESVLSNVITPLYFSNYVSIKQMKSTALAVLDRIGISGLNQKRVSLLSGGQKQRVAIARAIVTNPQLILADEPTGALDSMTANEIMRMFKSINNNGRTIIVVTHDLGVAQQCNRIIEISDGRIISDNQ